MQDYAGYLQWKGWLSGPPKQLADAHDAFRREVGCYVSEGTRVHELGFGEGHFMDWARARGAKVSGVEINEALVRAARDRGHDAELVQPGGTIGSIEAGTLDLVVAFDVLEHLTKSEISRVASAIAVALKDGGHFVARFPNGASPFSGPFQHGDVTHQTQLTQDSLCQLTGSSALRLVAARNAARPLTGGVTKRLVRGARYVVQATVGVVVSVAYYGRSLPLDPNATVLFRK